MNAARETYTDRDECLFVAYLGCWRDSNPELQIDWRTNDEFANLLHDYLRVNDRRADPIGQAGCRFARKCLQYGQTYLKQYLASIKNHAKTTMQNVI